MEGRHIVDITVQAELIASESLSDEAFLEYLTSYDQVLDLKGCTLMPGMVEGHAHISFPDSFDFSIPPEEHTLIAARGAKKLLGMCMCMCMCLSFVVLLMPIGHKPCQPKLLENQIYLFIMIHVYDIISTVIHFQD